MLTFLILTSLFVYLCYWFLTSPYDYWKKKKVPGPKPTLIFGNLGPSATLTQNLGEVYRDIYKKYQDLSYVGYYKFRKPGIILRDMNLIQDILVREFSSFHDNDFFADEKVDPLFAQNPFVLTGEKWKRIRSLVISGITHAKIKNMFSLIDGVGKNMVAYLKNNRDANSDNGIDAKELSARFTTDAVATCAFGIDAKSFTDEHSEFREMGRKFMNQDFLTGLKHMCIFIMPALAKILKVKLIPKEVEDWFGNVIYSAIKYREDNKIERPDYLDMLMALKAKTHGNFTNQDILVQAMTFYGDGFETSSTVICFAIYHLAKNQDIQEKLFQEIQETLEKYNGELTYDAILEMKYLEKVFSETLRMHGPVLFLARLCTKEFELPPARKDGKGKGVVVKIGTPMIVPVLAIHYEPEIWPEPEKFDPERFSEENIQSRPKCSFLAFGEGPRICLGNRFGVAQTKAAIVHLVKEFEIKLNKKTKEPIELDPNFFMTAAKGGVWANFYPRTK